ncbi:MAG: hypothetical protein Q4E12_07080 [Coriobacteriia bacterium]|nr:hypothetical protein [Coriobacteriia bacterium]
MSERELVTEDGEVPEIDEYLERVLLLALEEGRAKIEAGELLVPFSALAIKDNLFIETHPGDTADECFEAAKHTVERARGAGAYAFCYDGFVETDEGDLDCVIAEGGQPGEAAGYAIGFVYQVNDDETVTFEDEPVYVGEAPNFMWNLSAPGEYTEEEIDPRYQDGETFEEEE